MQTEYITFASKFQSPFYTTNMATEITIELTGINPPEESKSYSMDVMASTSRNALL